MKLLIVRSVLLVLVVGWWSGTAFASGRYAAGQPGGTANSSRVLYSIGKNIFTGKTRLSNVTDAPDQDTMLSALQAALPPSVQRRVDLTDFAGKLTEKQFRALQSYLATRYKIQTAQ